MRVHPDAAWDMMQISHGTSASLPQVIQVRSAGGDACADVKAKGAGARWERLLSAMYHHRTSMVWQGVDHLCITADSSTHSYEDALLALAYSHELDRACYPPLQYIVPGMAKCCTQFPLAVGIGLRRRT